MDDFRYDPYLRLYIDFSKHDVQPGKSFMSDDAHGHLCTATGGTWRLDGRYFDGDDLISCGTSNIFSITEQITVWAWIYQIGTGSDRGVVSRDDNTNVAYALVVGNQGGNPAFQIRDGGVEKGVGRTDAGNVALNEWKFIAGTYDGANVRLWIDNGGTVVNTNTLGYVGDIDAVIGAEVKIALFAAASFNDCRLDKVGILSKCSNQLDLNDIYLQTRGRKQ